MNRFLIVALLNSAAVFSLVYQAAAEDARPESCKQEIVEACPGIKVSTGKLGECIRKHLEEFSNECREIVQRRLPQKCIDDAKTVCPDRTLGDGKFGACMRKNIKKFSQTCRYQVNSWYQVSQNWRSKAQAACTKDAKKCPWGPGKKWWACLRSHQDALSDACKAFIQAN